MSISIFFIDSVKENIKIKKINLFINEIILFKKISSF